jgi:hybrid cluster-associated redox disulfide protein
MHKKGIWLISRNTTVGEIIEKHPSAIEVLLWKGIHCVGCHAAFFETIEQGLRAHGFSEEEIDETLKELNEKITG